jgi:hypothetical protein
MTTFFYSSAFHLFICLLNFISNAVSNYLLTVFINFVLFTVLWNLRFLRGMRRMLRLVLYLVFLSIKVACVAKIEYELRRVVWKNRISGLPCCQLAKSLTTYCSSIGIKLTLSFLSLPASHLCHQGPG